MKDHYRTLGVPENASEQEIKLAYRKLAKRYHPDVNAGAKGAEERFKEIVEAYDILSDSILRHTYDLKKRRGNLFAGNYDFYNQAPEEKKDPRKKEYSEEDLEYVRKRHKKKRVANIARRKKILTGMIITFILFMIASAGFENWIEEKRNQDSNALSHRIDSLLKVNQKSEKKEIENMDSPYDNVFGSGVYVNYSPNHFVIYMPFSDAVICAVQNDTPFKTVRNEFIRAENGFVMKEMPEGSYFIKMYTGKNWDVNKKVPDGRKLGGFLKDEVFYKVHYGPYILNSRSKNPADTNTVDTIFLNPSILKLDTISRTEFFDAGKS